MRYNHLTIALLFICSSVLSQKKLQRTIKELNTESVPYIHVNELKTIDNAILLDTRKKEEYDVSHLKNAIWVGYESFNVQAITDKISAKDTTLVVYCSIGVRSEDIGEKLQHAGYTNVKNLYGGIFQWKNEGNIIYKNTNTETDSVHTFDKQWGKLLTKGIKVYDTKKGN